MTTFRLSLCALALLPLLSSAALAQSPRVPRATTPPPPQVAAARSDRFDIALVDAPASQVFLPPAGSMYCTAQCSTAATQLDT